LSRPGVYTGNNNLNSVSLLLMKMARMRRSFIPSLDGEGQDEEIIYPFS